MQNEKKGTNKRTSFTVVLSACLISAVAALIFNLMPLLINSAKMTFSFNDQQLGLMGSFFLLGFTLATFTALFWIQRINWRTACLIGMLILVPSLLLAANATQSSWLYFFLATSGLGASILFCIVMSVLAETSDPDSSFGIKVAVEVGVASALLYLIPRFISNLPFDRVMYSIALVTFFMGLMLFKLPAGSSRKTIAIKKIRGGNSLLAWFGLVGLLLYFAGQTAEWVFLGRIGQAQGFDEMTVGKTLSFVKFLGAAGSLTAGIVGNRFGRLVPLSIGFFLFFVSVGFLLNANTVFNYVTGGALFEYSWGVLLAYLMGVIATTDQSGRLIVLIPSTLAIGGAFGPGVAGYLKTGESFAPVIWFTAVTAFVGMVIFLGILRSLRQRVASVTGAVEVESC